MGIRHFAVGLALLFIVNSAHAQEASEDDKAAMDQFLYDQYQQLRRFHDQNRTKIETLQREVTYQIAVPVQRVVTRQVPVQRRTCRYVRRFCRNVCVCSTMTVMETRQETVTTSVLESRTRTEQVQRSIVTGIAFTSDTMNTKRLDKKVNLDALPAAAGPEGDRMSAEAKLAAKVRFDNDQVADDERVLLESEWFREGPYQMQVTISAKPVPGTPENDVSIMMIIKNAIPGVLEPGASDERPVAATTLARARSIRDAIAVAYKAKKP
ncbi:MAG: hypothetical protein AAF497_14890 [Planctomycetota bacterium]